MSEGSSSVTSVSRGLLGALGGERPIVLNAVHTQNSLEGENVPKATCSSNSPIESRHAKIFSEHRESRSTDTTYLDFNEQLAQHHPTVKHSLGPADLTRSRGLNLSAESTEFPPITQKPTEGKIYREHHLGFSTIKGSENITHINR